MLRFTRERCAKLLFLNLPMKSIKLLLGTLIFLVFIFAVYFIVAFVKNSLQKINRDVYIEHEDEFLLELTMFEWDQMCIFGAYTPEEQINQDLGGQFGIQGPHYDGFSKVIFTKDDKVIRNITVPPEFNGSRSLKDNVIVSLPTEEVGLIEDSSNCLKK